MTGTITARFIGTSTTSFVAFITTGDKPEVRVSLDLHVGKPWKCSVHGRQAGPDCPHADAIDAANQLRTESR